MKQPAAEIGPQFRALATADDFESVASVLAPHFVLEPLQGRRSACQRSFTTPR